MEKQSTETNTAVLFQTAYSMLCNAQERGYFDGNANDQMADIYLKDAIQTFLSEVEKH